MKPLAGGRGIGRRLAVSFAGIVLLMLVGDAVSFWQLGRARARAERFYQVERKATTVLRLHTGVLDLRARLEELLDQRDARRFRAEAPAVGQRLAADAEAAIQALTADASDAAEHASHIQTLEAIRTTLAPQVDALSELAAAGDWEALRRRLDYPVKNYRSATAALVDVVSRDVAAEEVATLQDMQRLERQVVVMLGLTGLFTLVLAAVLGLAATRSITRPLATLDKAVQALARGEFGQHVAVAGRDELAGLATVFNDMAQRLGDLYAGLQKSEEKYRSIVENSVEGIFQSTPEGRVLTANPALARMLGYASPEELVSSMTDVERQLYVDPVRRQELLRAVQENGVVQGFECELRRRGGDTLWVSVNARAVRDETGRIAYLEGTNQDISDRRRAQALQESLQRSESMSAMGNLVAGVAHEARNPLFSISANLDAFEARFGQHRDYAETIVRLRTEVDRLAALMRDLLEFGRPVQEHVEPGSLAEVIREAVGACRALAQQAGVTVKSELAPDLDLIPMDRRRLAQAFENLVRNAVQHSPRGGTVQVAVAHERREGVPWVRCAVQDSGPGFRAEDLADVFRPFFTRRPGGTGLGLSIVQRIVESHRGEVAAGNRAGGGAEMTVSLPLRATSPPAR
jgi:PAS domain S-box-containing protein